MLLVALILLLATPAFWSCSTETAAVKDDREHTEAYKVIDDTLIQGYLNRNRITNYTRTNSGLYLIPVTEGTGATVSTGKTVTVRYIGRYLGYALNGRIFENSTDNHSACGCAPFVVGQQIAGWNEGLQLMRQGDRKVLLIPSYLAYGRYGSVAGLGNDLFEDQPLMFDMEIISVSQ